MSKLMKALSFILYLAVWYVISLVASALQAEGNLSVIHDAFGAGGVAVLVVLAVVCFGSFFWLRLFLKKEAVIQLISYGLVLLFTVALFATIRIGDNRFIAFSAEKWADYPDRRITMYYNDLANRTDDLTADEIVALLGTPDTEKDGVYYYYDTHGNSVWFRFQDGKVSYSDTTT